MFLRGLVEVEAGLAEVCAGDGDGGYGCGLSAKNAGAEGDGPPRMVDEELELFGGPAAFRTDGEGDAVGL